MKCDFCQKTLSRDEKSASQKLLGRRVEKALCIGCLAGYMGCDEEDLLLKIEQYKEQGCSLFR